MDPTLPTPKKGDQTLIVISEKKGVSTIGNANSHKSIAGDVFSSFWPVTMVTV